MVYGMQQAGANMVDSQLVNLYTFDDVSMLDTAPWHHELRI